MTDKELFIQTLNGIDLLFLEYPSPNWSGASIVSINSNAFGSMGVTKFIFDPGGKLNVYGAFPNEEREEIGE